MKKWLIIFLLACGPGYLTAQNEWVLQTYLEVAGDTVNQELGQFVTGFRNSQPNMPYNLAVGQSKSIGCYMIGAPDDTLPQRIFRGPNLVHGDFNGDGYTDLAVHQVTQVLFGDNLDTVAVYLGNPTDIDTIPNVKIPEERNGSSNNFGSIMTSGDLNGDGFDDLVICAPNYYGLQWIPGTIGKIYIYLGKRVLQSNYDLAIIGTLAANNYAVGWGAAIGDINNDGYGDLSVIGFDQHDPIESNRFTFLEIYLGSSDFDISRDYYLKGSYYGYAVACFDANGDGVADVLWSNKQRIPGRGGPTQAVLIFFGGTDFDLNFDFIIPHPDTTISYVHNFGEGIANAGDMNGDGYDDILISAPQSFYGDGIVFVYSGGKALDTFFDAARGQRKDANFGSYIAGIGDVNGDQLDDIIVGARYYPWGKTHGYFAVLLGDQRIPNEVIPDPYTQVRAPNIVPNRIILEQNYPNPFNSSTQISYRIPNRSQVHLTIIDILGKEVKRLVNHWQEAGEYTVSWDSRDFQNKELPSGVYFYELKTDNYTERKSMLLIR